MIIIYKQDAPVLESNEESERKARSVAVEVLKILTA